MATHGSSHKPLMSRLATLARSLGALVVLAALTVGVPALLAQFSNPIAHAVDVFGDPLASDRMVTEALVTGVFVGLGWLLWVMLVVAIARQVVRGTRTTVDRAALMVPGVQALASRLVVSAALVTTLFSSPSTAAAVPLDAVPVAVDVDEAPTGATADAAPADRVVDSVATYVTSRGDSWWTIAERTLGSGTRWREIRAANTGVTMAEGITIGASTDKVLPGWTLRLPSGAATPGPAVNPDPATPGEHRIHIVSAGDSLWEIAATHVARGGTNAEISAAVEVLVDANLGLEQPDGRTLSDPGVLEPGWTIIIPGSAPETEAAPPPAAVEVEAGDTLWGIASEHLGDGHRYSEIVDVNIGRPQPDGSSLVDPDLIEPGWNLNMPAAANGDTATPEVTIPVEHPAPSTAPAPAPAPTPTTPAPTTSALAVPVEVAPRPTIAPSTPDTSIDAPDSDEPAGPAVPAWPGLAVAGVATAAVVALLDRRRRVQRHHRRRGHTMPAPSPEHERAERELRAGAATTRAERASAALRAAALGAGIGGLPPIRYLTVSDDTVTIALVTAAPAPPQFTISGDDGAEWTTAASVEMLDSNVAAATALDPLPLLCPIGHAFDDARSDVLIDLESARTITICGPDTDRASGLLRAMALATATGAWGWHPEIHAVGLGGQILDLPWVHHPNTLVEALDQLTGHRGQVAKSLRYEDATVAEARASGATPDAWEPVLVLSAHPAWEPHRRDLEALATDPPAAAAAVVLDPAAGDVAAGVQLHVDDHGHIDCPGIDIVVAALDLGVDDVRVVADLLDAADQPAVDVPIQVDDAPPRVREAITLSAGLEDADVVVRVMGDVSVERVPDGDRITFAGKAEEAVVFLAAGHDGGGVLVDTLQAALWPAGTNSPKTFHNAISAARKALGEIPDVPGEKYLGPVTDGRYWLSDRVVTDFEVFWALRSAADETDDPEEGAAHLENALSFVRGEAFTGPRARDYAWTASLRTAVTVAVVETADELAEIQLARGDAKAAERAARAGLLASPAEERLYAQLLRAAGQAGSRSTLQSIWRELLAAVADPDTGIEPEATVSPETEQLYASLLDKPRTQSA